MGFLYKIYDTKKEEWIPGEYHKSEVQRMLDTRVSISEWAYDGKLIKSRWRIDIVNKLERVPPSFTESWNEAVKVLRGSRRDLSQIRITAKG